MPSANRSTSNRLRPRGFTLTELLIAVAMVLILMAGIVKVFSYATNSIGAGMAISDIIRAQRVISAVLPADTAALSNDITKCPAILLDSQQNYLTPPATPGQAWYTVWTPGSANTYSNGFALAAGAPNQEGGITGPIFLNKANESAYLTLGPSDVQFRQDTFSFFADGSFTRQTGNDGQFAISMKSNRAWIWYGHLWLPTNGTNSNYSPSFFINSTTPSYAGAGTSSSNPNNFYASQWALGRVAMLIMEKNQPLVSGAYTDIVPGAWPNNANNKHFQSFINDFTPTGLAAGNYLVPLAFTRPIIGATAGQNQSRDFIDNNTTSTSVGPQNTSEFAIEQSRYDLAGVESGNTGDPFADYFSAKLNQSATIIPPTYVNDWWYSIDFSNFLLTNGLSLNYRFQANPYPVRPLVGTDNPAGAGNGGSAKASGTVPILAAGCARFYVEYAGDFINQNADGTSTSVTNPLKWNFTLAGYQPDGTDFYVDANHIRHIRWYGLPRDADGDGVISTVGATSNASPQTGDVLPLAYYLSQSTTVTTQASFEKWPAPNSWPPAANLFSNFTHYICAWDATPASSSQPTIAASARPTMFRITIELADPAGRLGNTRVLQYIVPVQQQ